MSTIRPATLADIATIRTIAHTAWPVAYGSIITAEQIAYMLERMYSEASLHEQMTTKGHRFFLLERDGTPQGFAGYELRYNGGPNARLHKLYVLPTAKGTGAGKALLNAVADEARMAGARALELNVNKYNPSKHFYAGQGFHVVRDEVLDIGSGFVMDDHIMELPL